MKLSTWADNLAKLEEDTEATTNGEFQQVPSAVKKVKNKLKHDIMV